MTSIKERASKRFQQMRRRKANRQMRRTAALLKVDDDWSLDTAKLRTEITHDFDNIIDDFGSCRAANGIGVGIGELANIDYIFEMSDFNDAFREMSKKDIIEYFNDGKLKFDFKDKYIVFFNDDTISTTSKNYDKMVQEIGDKVYDKIIKSFDNDTFNDIYDNYDYSTIDNSLVRNKE